MKLTRDDVLKKAKTRPLHRLGWSDLRGTMRSFSEADVVTIHENGKVNIKKDRQGTYLDLARDKNGLVDEAEFNSARTHG